jgi:hypothetical protein
VFSIDIPFFDGRNLHQHSMRENATKAVLSLS